jgi:Cu-processing system permease protein
VVAVFAATAVITWVAGGWWPDRVLAPAAGLALAVALLAALSLAGSVVLSPTANGIAILMVFGARLVAGLLGQIGEALGSDTLERWSGIAAWALPFEALFQQGLAELTADTTGLHALRGGDRHLRWRRGRRVGIWPYSIAYVGVVGALGVRAFARRDP